MKFTEKFLPSRSCLGGRNWKLTILIQCDGCNDQLVGTQRAELHSRNNGIELEGTTQRAKTELSLERQRGI